MAGIPSKCPKCGRTKAWKEDVNPFRSGISAGIFGRIRISAPTGLLAKPIMKAAGYYNVTYRCHNCGFRKEYPTEDS